MRPYEETLNKISPIFYKFISYSRNFLENRANILNFINYDFDVEHYYSSNKVNYSLLIIRKSISHDRPYVWYFIISLRKSNGFMVDLTYGFTQFMTTMVINDFSFENQKIVASRRPLYISLPSKDLFIKLVGNDTYDAIRRNIK